MEYRPEKKTYFAWTEPPPALRLLQASGPVIRLTGRQRGGRDPGWAMLVSCWTGHIDLQNLEPQLTSAPQRGLAALRSSCHEPCQNKERSTRTRALPNSRACVDYSHFQNYRETPQLAKTFQCTEICTTVQYIINYKHRAIDEGSVFARSTSSMSNSGVLA